MHLKIPRRLFLHLAAGVAALPAISSGTCARSYPTRPIRILVGFSAGGAVDIVARLIAEWLSARLQQTVFVEDRPGAATNIATEVMVHSPPDGYTLLLTNPTNAINATFYEKLPYDFLRDSDPVVGIMRVPNVMVVGPSVPANTVPEFIAYANANPGKVYYASSGNGTSVHMSAELFKAMTHVELLNVTYRGMAGGAYTDLMTGRVQVAFDNLPGSIGYVRAGKLRALAVTTTTASDVLPGVPTVAEFVPGYEAAAWYGLSAPKSTPIEIIERLNKEVNAGLVDSDLRTRLDDLGGMMLGGSPGDFGKFVAEETDKWAKVIRAAGIKAT